MYEDSKALWSWRSWRSKIPRSNPFLTEQKLTALSLFHSLYRNIPIFSGFSLFRWDEFIPNNSKKIHPQFQRILPPSAWGCPCLATQNPLRQYLHLGLKSRGLFIHHPQMPKQKKGRFFFRNFMCKSGHCHSFHMKRPNFSRVLNQLCQFRTPSQSSFFFSNFLGTSTQLSFAVFRSVSMISSACHWPTSFHG